MERRALAASAVIAAAIAGVGRGRAVVPVAEVVFAAALAASAVRFGAVAMEDVQDPAEWAIGVAVVATAATIVAAATAVVPGVVVAIAGAGALAVGRAATTASATATGAAAATTAATALIAAAAVMTATAGACHEKGRQSGPNSMLYHP